MAEGWAKNLIENEYEIYSAGIKTHGLNPKAVLVMKEVGIDISAHRSKTLSELEDIDFDIVFTVCGHAEETCPAYLKQTKRVHIGFDDPPQLEKLAKSEEEALDHYRRVRDEIQRFVITIKEGK